ncbi:MAG: hypothetical protein [Bacteriophage sp.]|nr:MAG: hypothetical protein [Bacteriophage sp.]UWG92244.1 MAG: hypothetical protein [Bacteriophage sp.]
MLIEDEKCFINGAKCDKVSSCKYFRDRFGLANCYNKTEFEKNHVEMVHQYELLERSKLKTWSDKKEYLNKEVDNE